MSNCSFVQIYRDLLLHPCVTSSPPSYRCVLYTLLAYACFTPCKQDDHGVIIDLSPGQFMCTFRHLAELSNVGKKDVEHAVEKFVKNKILGQEVRHKKSIFTILWGLKLENGGTRLGTKKGQERDIKEEDKNVRMSSSSPSPQKKEVIIPSEKKKEEDEEDGKKINNLIAACKKHKLPFTESGIYQAYKLTSGLSVQNALNAFLKRNPKAPTLILPDAWLRKACIKEFEFLEQKKDYE